MKTVEAGVTGSSMRAASQAAKLTHHHKRNPSMCCMTAVHLALLTMALHGSSEGRTLSTNLASERLFTFLGRRK